jgi:hypothetical protein
MLFNLKENLVYVEQSLLFVLAIINNVEKMSDRYFLENVIYKLLFNDKSYSSVFFFY